MFCPHCGTKNPAEHRYCYSCGRALPLPESPAPAAAPAPASTAAAPQLALKLPAWPADWPTSILPTSAAWTQGAIGAALAAGITWVLAVVLRAVLLSGPIGKMLGSLVEQVYGNRDTVKPAIGLIYSLLHQVPVLIRASASGQGAHVTVHLPILLGLLIVGPALWCGGRLAAWRLRGGGHDLPFYTVGVSVALPYALFSTVLGWIGGQSMRSGSGPYLVEGSWAPALLPLFGAALVLALIFASFGAASHPWANGHTLAYWLPAGRQALRSLALGLAAALVLTILIGAAADVWKPGLAGTKAETSLLGDFVSELGGERETLLVTLPITAADFHALGHLIPLERGIYGPYDTGRENEKLSLTDLPDWTTNWPWLFVLIPLYFVPAAGFRGARAAGAADGDAVKYGAVTGLLYGMLLAGLGLAARIGVTIGADGMAGMHTAIGVSFLNALVLGCLVGGVLGAAGGSLARSRS